MGKEKYSLNLGLTRPDIVEVKAIKNATSQIKLTGFSPVIPSNDLGKKVPTPKGVSTINKIRTDSVNLFENT